MAVNKEPILKRCRALGIEPAVLGISKKSKRAPKVSARKVSEYGLQLREKQKAKFIYGVMERQFRNYFKKATRMQGISGENLLRMLESRLDNVIFRMGLARTRREARQIVSHRLIRVNGRRLNIPSYAVKPGDVIEVIERSAGSDLFKNITAATESRLVPPWLSSDLANFKGSVVNLPTREDIDVPVNETLIVEFYSKML